jgi:ribosomal protein L40E
VDKDNACAKREANLLLFHMQPTTACTNCGADIPSEARFCRACGQRSVRLDANSVTEGTTRLLETPERPASSFDQHIYEQPGGLAQPTSRIPSQANETSRSLEVSRKSPQWVLIGSILIAVIALTALFVILLNRPSTPTTVSPPAVTRPEQPPIPPPPPPMPPQGSTQGTTINRAFVYPGAETTMEVTSADEGNVIQLQTSDSFDKVVDWYTEKLKPTKVVRSKDPTSNDINIILEAGELKAIINTNGGKTTIMLAQEGD